MRAAAAEEAPARGPAPPPPRRPARPSAQHRRKMRRRYADKMLRSPMYEDKSQGWDLFGSAPA